MTRIVRSSPILLAAGACLFLGTEAGADWLPFRRATMVPPPLPLGSAVRDWQMAQAAAADLDHFVIYRHEWLQGGVKLGPYGQYHLDQIVKRLASVPVPVLIQVEPNPKLNEQRRLEIVNLLLRYGIADAPARVTIGFPRGEGLYADEAARIFNQNYGGAMGGAFGGSGGMGGGSLSSGGLGGTFGSGFGGGFRGY